LASAVPQAPHPNIFLEDRKIIGTVLQSKFPNDVSPWFLTGFIEAEGNFDISVFPSPPYGSIS
jgi:ABC-type sulfate transport system substrate-binding protein